MTEIGRLASRYEDERGLVVVEDELAMRCCREPELVPDDDADAAAGDDDEVGVIQWRCCSGGVGW